jgi:hypothetical protein
MTPLIDERLGGMLWIIWFVLCLAISLFAWFYFRGNKDVGRKKLFHRRIVIIGGATFFLLIALSGMPWPFLLIAGAFIALIMYMNIRNTMFCGSCGRTTYNYEWWSRIEFCSKCGAKLRHD